MKTVMERGDVRIGRRVMDAFNQTHVVSHSNWDALAAIAEHGNLRLVEETTVQSLTIAQLQDEVEYWKRRALAHESADVSA